MASLPAPTLVANSLPGTFTATATAGGFATPAMYSLTNAPPMSAPTNVAAFATSPTSVSVSWNATAGATTYEILRLAPGGVYTTFSSGTTSFIDSTVLANTAYLYKLRVIAPSPSPYSNPDIATTVIFIVAVGRDAGAERLLGAGARVVIRDFTESQLVFAAIDEACRSAPAVATSRPAD